MTRVVAFGAGAPRTDPAALDVRELGAKGAGLVRLASIGVAVPPGFVVSTGDVAAFLAGGAWPGAVRTAVDDALVELERRAGRPLGTAATALRVAVRGGAAQSMPGLLTTVLGVASPDAMWSAMDEVAASWTAPDVVAFRRREGVPEAPPTAIVVQAMVDATADDRSGAGVATSRDPSTGAPGAWGEVVVRAPGAGLVGGTAQPLPLAHLATWLPDVQVELAAWLRSLERAWRDVIEVEFVVEAGRLWFVQVRPARRSAAAAVRIAVDLVADPDVAIDRADAVRRVDPAVVRALLDAVPAPAGGTVLATGVGASPGVGAGAVVFDPEEAVAAAAAGEAVVLVRRDTAPADVHAMVAASGVVTSRGGMASHAAVVARGAGIPAVVGADLDVHDAFADTASGERLVRGDVVVVDGTAGRLLRDATAGDAPAPPEELATLIDWATDVCRAHGGAAPTDPTQTLAQAQALLGR